MELLALSCLSVYPSVRPSISVFACNNSDSTGLICIKFDIRGFEKKKNLSRKFKFR